MRIQVVWNDLVEVSMEETQQQHAYRSVENNAFIGNRFLWPERFGTGYTQIYHCDKHHSVLGITHGSLQKNVRVRAGSPFTTLGLCFILSGNYHVNYSSHGNWQDRRGECVVWYLPDELLNGTLGGKEPLNIVDLSISMPLLIQWFQEEPEQFPRSWHPFLEGRHPTFLERSIIPPSLWTPLNQLVRWRPRGELQTLYMESKIQECLALHLAFLLGKERRTPVRLDLSSSDRKRVLEAALLVGAKLDDTPTLAELSCIVDLSESKLKRGFRQMFGMGVHGYVQMLRLEAARYLLDQQEMSIKQIAAQVGHTKQGHFSKLFRQYFGIKPKDYVKTLF